MSQAFELPRAGIRVRGDGSCLLVLEAGARWPSWIGEDAVGSLVVQNAQESTAEFASRAIRAIEQQRSARGSIRTLVLAAGRRLGDDVFAERCLICRAAIACMEQRKPSLLVFNGHDQLSADVRHELFTLAGALTPSIAGTRIAINVKIDSAIDLDVAPESAVPEESGVFVRAGNGSIQREVAS